MGKSLTEVAKGILMNESNDPSPDAGAKSTNPNMATLRPGSRLMEPNPMGNSAEMIADAPKSPGEGDNVGARAAMRQKKDTTVKQSVPAQPAEKMMAEEEEIELSEELESFIDQCIAEGMSEDEIAQAIDENFEFLEEGMEEMPTSSPVAPKRNVPVPRPAAGVGPGNNKVMQEEDAELSEELEAFIDQMIEEGYDEDEIAEAIEENFDLSEEDYNYSVDMSEHVAALFAGEELSEEFQAKAIAIFEAAVTSTVKSELAAIEEAYAATLEEEIDTIKEELSTNVDDYLNYVVESWVSDNEVAIEAGLRTELTEEFISGLRNLFAENYIDIPEDKISVVEELGEKVSELENKLNEEIERNVELTAVLSESKKSEVLYSVVEGLTTTQAEKLKSLAEGVEFTSEDEYAEKILTLRESYFPSSIRSQRQLDNIEPGMEGKSMISEELQGPMARYVEVLGKKLPN